ncbi:MAG: hypothetical protein Q9163_005723 [Psora crenata]
MGALSDITAKANNTKRPPDASSTGYQALSSPGKETLGENRSPHFMTPTFASKQLTTPTTNERHRSTTPVPVNTTKLDNNGNTFLKTAARRVGLRYTADGRPRSQKEVVPKHDQNIPFPDKLATATRFNDSESPPSVGKQSKAISPKDKPLPTPPIAQVDTTSPIEVSASLIDASEKPLRRSPTALPGLIEDWPVLYPQRAESSGTVQEMMRETGTQLKEQLMAPNEERYPRLGDSTNQKSAHQPPVSRYSAHNLIPQEVVAPDMQTASAKDSNASDPFCDAEIVVEHNNENPMQSIPTSHLSASAAAVEKSASQSSIEPRQTRTSTLRARLSAGSIVKENNSKVVGFTDFTAQPQQGGGPNRQESMRMRKEAQARSATSSAATSLRTQTSRESIGTNRAPAKFVAGSRRPVPPRRPGSRGSLHSEPCAPRQAAASRLPGRSLAPVPPMKSEVVEDMKRPELPFRRSSIPVPSNSVSDTRDHAEAISLDSNKDKMHGNRIKQVDGHGSGSSADRSIPDHVKDPGDATVTDLRDGATQASASISRKQTSGLEAIDESPRHTYQFKRLSSKFPEFGPILSISPSADRYIMGVDDDKENCPPNMKGSKDLEQAANASAQGSQTNGGISAATKKRLERPLSSHDGPHLGPRTDLIDPKAREKKARSADFSSRLETTAANLTAARPLSKNLSVTTNGSSTNDPFYDATEVPQGDGAITTQAEKEQATVTQGDGRISPIGKSPMPSGDTSSSDVTAIVHESPDVITKTTIEYDPFRYNTGINSTGHKGTGEEKQSTNVWPLTPEQTPPTNTAHSGRYPPRSSSRLDRPYMAVGSSQSPLANTAANGKAPPTPPKEFARRQNNLGSARGHGSSPVDLAHTASKRDSVARDSCKSATSLPKSQSKTRFNFKTLFHKRAHNAPEPIKASKKTKSKVAISSNGSPFPPISEIHPIHRPTLASVNRSSAPTPRLSTAMSTSRPLTPATPNLMSPPANEISRTTALAMSLLESARKETCSPKKEKLLELGKMMVDVITQARDAERAVEEAKLAVKKAEKASEGCRRAVKEVARLVDGVKGIGGDGF